MSVYVAKYVCFVCRMQEENSNTKRRKGKKWYEFKEAGEGDHDDGEEDSETPGTQPEQYAESTRPRSFKTGEQISFLGFGEVLMAHGTILDDEPDTNHQDTMLQYDADGYWKLVAITTVVRGWGATSLEVSASV
jgi:hypothetical protein